MSEDKRKFYIKFGGNINNSDFQHSSRFQNDQMEIKYFNVFSSSEANTLFSSWSGGIVDKYSDIFSNYTKDETTSGLFPIVENFKNDTQFSVKNDSGIVASTISFDNATIYRREYNVYTNPCFKITGYYYGGAFFNDARHTSQITPRQGIVYEDLSADGHGYYYKYDTKTSRYVITEKARTYIGEWEPVVLKSSVASMYDYNIQNNKHYQYILYPNDKMSFEYQQNSENTENLQVFANGIDSLVWIPDSTYPSTQGEIKIGDLNSSFYTGTPVLSHWDEWSVCELIPQLDIEDAPAVKKAYTVNTEQIWLFKYSLEADDQTQNIVRNEIQTLGQFPKIGFGKANYNSGGVKALLGSEIVLGSREKYVERLRKSRIEPLSTNERVKMLNKWKEFVSSKNPKLLKDIKGQSWIVQITSSSNTVSNFYLNQPDTISFKWKQIEDTKNIVINSPVDLIEQEDEAEGTDIWKPVF